MNNKTTFLIGILGAGLFVISSILGGVLIDDYSIISQFISETYAIDTQYGVILRFLGIIPSGILFTLFAYAAYTNLPQSNLTKLGFIGLGIFYGIATVIVGIFPCDSGCNKEFINPSLSQFIHNLIGSLTYMIVPLCIILIAVGIRKLPLYKRLSNVGIAFGTISYLFVILLSSNPNSEFIGLYQRIIEAVFILWIVSCAVKLKNEETSRSQDV
ncbi:MAG: DUF998 domain-containing protein [Winogradskyella sp.]|uniref:DUF998 domain-containing protein n=1 Tax=Winogradskyella sp. TaxID=1883156 RepID=UPI00183FF548|nr:DUF998 domain-containing protein [Winogradskyella sp.]